MAAEPSQPRPTVPIMTYTTQPPTLFHPHVDVRVSKRRKKTAGAHWEGDRIVVVVPAHLRGTDRDAMVEVPLPPADPPPAPSARLRRPTRAAGPGPRRCYLDDVTPSSIRWSTTQVKRWGSCTLETREIRISERLRVVPDWVLDAVIVHELAHLFEPNSLASLPRP